MPRKHHGQITLLSQDLFCAFSQKDSKALLKLCIIFRYSGIYLKRFIGIKSEEVFSSLEKKNHTGSVMKVIIRILQESLRHVWVHGLLK